MTEIPTSAGTATVSIWSRNLLNEEHIFANFMSTAAGLSGFYNEPRTLGFEINLKM